MWSYSSLSTSLCLLISALLLPVFIPILFPSFCLSSSFYLPSHFLPYPLPLCPPFSPFSPFSPSSLTPYPSVPPSPPSPLLPLLPYPLPLCTPYPSVPPSPPSPPSPPPPLPPTPLYPLPLCPPFSPFSPFSPSSLTPYPSVPPTPLSPLLPLLPLLSWYPVHQVVWHRGGLQCTGDGTAGAQPRGSLQLLQSQVLPKNRTATGRPTGTYSQTLL